MPLFDQDRPSGISNAERTDVIKRNVSSQTRVATLLPANRDRVGATIVNRSSAALFIDFDPQVSSSDYMVEIPPGWYFELPFHPSKALYGVWRTANGQALIRDFVSKEVSDGTV